VTRKLAGADAGTTQWMTSVGNERGQVLMSVLTAAEGYGLRDMATGLQERYRQAGQDPPSVLYVDRDCCRSDGGTCAAAALFPEWPQLAVRLDVWHYIRRLAAGVTTESHTLYSEFLCRLSRSIFEWDPEDFARLDRAKNGELSRRPIAFKEMARHCRRRTRGVEATERLLDETIKAFTGATDMMGIPVLDSARMREIWRTQRRHIACIQ
ncbi:Epithelial-stromal interaction 1, partial [Clarias magur]